MVEKVRAEGETESRPDAKTVEVDRNSGQAARTTGAGGGERTMPGPAPKVARPHRPAKKKPVAKPGRPKPTGKTDIGINVKPPARTCTDRNCPFHGRLPVRGLMFEGVVVSDKMDRSAVIERERLLYVPKYERYMKRTSRMSVHNPPCISAKVGDQVVVMECRPLSKTISFTIVSKKGV